MPELEQTNNNLRRNSACLLDDLLQDAGLPLNINHGSFSIVLPELLEKNLKTEQQMSPKLPPCSLLFQKDNMTSQHQNVSPNNLNTLKIGSSCRNGGGMVCPNGITIKSEPQDDFPMQCNGSNHAMLPTGLSVECSMTIKQELSYTPPCQSTSPLSCNPLCNQPIHAPTTTNQYKFTFNNYIQQSCQNMNLKDCQQQQQFMSADGNYFCQMPPTPPSSHPGSPANPTCPQPFPGCIENSVLGSRGPPPPYEFAIATHQKPVPVQNGTPTLKYNRKNNPDLEKRRVHFCHYPGM